MYRRCEKHNLAAGPDGKCALCRRSIAPAFADIEIEESGWMSRGITVLLGVVTLVAIGLTVWWVKSPNQSPLNPSYLQRDSALRGIGNNYQEGAENANAALAGAGDKAATGPETRELKLLTEEEKARREIPIVIYSTTECPISRQARAYMKRMHFEFEERNIDTNAAALARVARINPVLSTPTFEVDDEVMIGFSEKKLLEAIDRAVAAKSKKPSRARRK